MLNDIKEKLGRANILVIGDLILDKFVYGDVERINPEAPVPVLLVEKDEYKLGGAANVAANVVSMGGRCTLVGQIGIDDAGKRFKALADAAGINTYLIERGDFATMVKTRIVARNQQVIRVDRERPKSLNAEHTKEIAHFVKDGGYDLVVVSDYAKGVVNEKLMSCLKSFGMRVVVDPKPSNKHLYAGVFIVTPNIKESDELCPEVDMASRGHKIVKMLDSNIVITRGQDGASLFTTDGQHHYIPAKRREVYDVMGAGDTFVAALALAVAAGLDLVMSCSFANLAAGVAVEKVGTSVVTFDELADSIGEKNRKIKNIDELKSIVTQLHKNGRKVVFTNGCFDILHVGHTKLLKEAKSYGDDLILGLNTDKSIKLLKGPGRPINDQNDRAELISHIPYIDYIVFFDDETPCDLISELRPDIHVKGGDYDPKDYSKIPEARIVDSYGGKVVVVKYVEGKSTTSAIDALRNLKPFNP